MQALGQIVKFGNELLTLKGQVEKNTLDIKAIREDLDQLATAIQNLKHEMELHQLKQEYDLKTQRLELENALLRHLRLPSANDAPTMLPPSE